MDTLHYLFNGFGVALTTGSPWLGAIAAIIVGKQAQNEIAASGGRQGGENRAKWGIILGWISIVISVLVVIVVSVTYST